MIRKLHYVGGTMLALLVVCGTAAADEAVTFRYKMAEGDTIIYRLTATMKQTQTFGETKIATTMKVTKIDAWKVQKVNEKGNFETRVETKRLKVKFKIDPVGDYTFDSTASEQETGTTLSEAMNPIYERLATANLTVTLSPRGQVRAVGGYKELLADLLKDNPLGAQLAGGGSDESAKMNLADQFIVFSEKPVEPGDSWEEEIEADIPGIGKVTGKRVFTYEGPDKVGELPTAKFSVTVELSIAIDIMANGSQISGTLSTNDSTGTVQFDPEKGRIVSKKSTYTLAGDISVSVNGNDLTINTSQTHTSELELLDKLPE